MTESLVTARLTLRPFTPDDLSWLDALHADPEVYRYLGDGNPRPTELHRRWLARAIEGHREGIGQRVVELDGRPIGRCGLSRYWRSCVEGEATLALSAPPDVERWSSFLEMGWTFERAAWGQGFAIEAARGVLGAFTPHTSEPIFAMIHRENARSIRVAERLGWTLAQLATLYGRPSALYGPCGDTLESSAQSPAHGSSTAGSKQL